MSFIIVLTVNLLFSQNVANKAQLIADNHGLFESNLNENWFKEKRKKSKRDNRQRKRETRIIWYLTDELELSADQAEKFFPHFRAHREEIQKIRIQIQHIGGEKIDKFDQEALDKLTFDEISEMIDKYHGLRKKIIDIEADFMFKMKNVLTPKQIALFLTFKERMMNNMVSELEHKKSKRDKKRGRGRKKRIF